MLATGDKIGAYEIEETLGFGGMGIVYRATHQMLGRQVALKVLAPHLAGDDSFRERFQREARLTASLEHPNIATIYDADEDGDTLFIAMSLIRGVPLSGLIKTGVLTPDRSVELLGSIASALDAAHGRGLVHRDVKPGNILVGTDDLPFLVDFGITKELGQTNLTQTNRVVGSLGYVSPEQIRGESLTASSDVYSLAIVLFECLTGRVPFDREGDTAVLFAHLNDPPPPVNPFRQDLPPALDGVIARGMAKMPGERYRTATELIDAARLALQASAAAPSAVVPPGPAPVAEPAARPEAPVAQTHGTVIDRQRPVAEVAAAPRAPWQRHFVWAAIPVAAGVGIAAGAATKPHHHAIAAVAATGGSVSVSHDDAWSRPATAPHVDGLALAHPTALSLRKLDGDGVAVIGELEHPASGSVVLPTTLTRRLKAPIAVRRVRLGVLDAVQYTGAVVGGLALTSYVIPTSVGYQTVTCQGPTSASSFTSACGALAATARLGRGVRPGAVSPDPRFAARIADALTQLGGRRRRDAAQLDRGSAKHRAVVALSLASAHRRAARTVAKATAPAQDAAASRSLVRAMHNLALDFTRVARSARNEDADGYARNLQHVTSSDAKLDAALGALRTAGYRVG